MPENMPTLLFLLIAFEVGYSQGVTFYITSVNCGMDEREQTTSFIKVSGKEHSKQKDGINIIVYDIAKETVSHSRHFSDPNTKYFINFIQTILPGKLIIGTSQILCTEKSATNLNRQKSILYALRRLGFDTHALKPFVFRGGVFAYCKESCYPNITSTIDLPYSKVHRFNEGPLLLSFRINKVSNDKQIFASNANESDGKDADYHSPHTTLYAIIVSCSLFVVLSVCGIAICLVRRYKKEKQHWNIRNDAEKMRERLGNTKQSCELLFLSKEKSECYKQQERYVPTTSARLFSMYSNNGEEEKSSMGGFASYVKVETQDHHLIYKIPSGVSKHDPPLHPPSLFPLQNKSNTIKTNRSSSEYLTPHEYAHPDSRYELRSIYQEVDPKLFEEYTSLETTDNYVNYHGERKYDNEPIYDDCDSDYIVP